MSGPRSRRAALRAGAIALGAVAMTTTTMALPAADLDAELYARLDRWRAALAALDTASAAAVAASARLNAIRPLVPDALFWRPDDVLLDLGPARGHEGVNSQKRRGLFDARDVERLRSAAPLMKWASPDSETEAVRVPDLTGEARRREIVEAHDGWRAAYRAAEEACGLTRCRDLEETAADVWSEAEDDVVRCPARTLRGLCRKAGWIADLMEREAAADYVAEHFAREVAAFGGVVA